MTKQETFDIVAKHLLTQNARAVGLSGACKYKAPDGKACAIGCLIPSDKYDPAFEGGALGTRSALRELMSNLGHDLRLLYELQIVHDQCPVEEWPNGLTRVAQLYDLEFNFQ